MYVHGDNIEQKLTSRKKYTDAESKRYLAEINERYVEWKKANLELKGPFSEKSDKDHEILAERVRLLQEYKDFIDQQHYAEKFDSRSNLHSSVLEEFIYYLFKDIVRDFSENALIGKSHAFKDMFFVPDNYKQMVTTPNVKIEKKDHDFVIGATMEMSMQCVGSSYSDTLEIQVPAVAIECKTYIDKTMLEGSSMAAAQLKAKNPNGIYIMVSEWLKLGDVNMKKYDIDQAYILRKQKNTDREYRFEDGYVKNPIYLDVVEHLFETVRTHLTTNWEGGIEHGLSRGYLV